MSAVENISWKVGRWVGSGNGPEAGSIAPRGLFEINFAFTIIVAALIGGAGTVWGPVLGAFFLTFLLEYLRPWLPGAERYFIYGGVALLLYMWQPKGLAAIITGGIERLRR